MTGERTQRHSGSELACRTRRLAGHVLVGFSFFLTVLAATAGERSVTAAETSGTYRDIESKSKIKIFALGHGKLKVQLALVYEHHSATGLAANVGDALAKQRSRTTVAVFVPEGAGDCEITMTFLPNGKLKVEQQGGECGFGHNVRADGTFRKISNRKPKFDDA